MTVRMREKYVETPGDLTKAGYDVLSGMDRRIDAAQDAIDRISARKKTA